MLHAVLPYVLCVLIFLIGLYAIAVKKNLIKVIIGVILIDNAVNLFLVLVGFRQPAGGAPMAPIMTPDMGPHQKAVAQLLMLGVDPLPQALVLTSIVIGLSVVALMVVMALRLHEKYGTFDLTLIRRLKG